jgi:hypothetical protein
VAYGLICTIGALGFALLVGRVAAMDLNDTHAASSR